MNVQFLELIVIPKYLNSFVFSVYGIMLTQICNPVMTEYI